MTDDMMNLRSLVEKSADADLLREMIGFAAEKLMALEVGAATGAGYGEKTALRLVQRIEESARDKFERLLAVPFVAATVAQIQRIWDGGKRSESLYLRDVRGLSRETQVHFSNAFRSEGMTPYDDKKEYSNRGGIMLAMRDLAGNVTGNPVAMMGDGAECRIDILQEVEHRRQAIHDLRGDGEILRYVGIPCHEDGSRETDTEDAAIASESGRPDEDTPADGIGQPLRAFR